MYFSKDRKTLFMPSDTFDAIEAIRICRNCGWTDGRHYLETHRFDQQQIGQLYAIYFGGRYKCFLRCANRDYSSDIISAIHNAWVSCKQPIRRERLILLAILGG